MNLDSSSPNPPTTAPPPVPSFAPAPSSGGFPQLPPPVPTGRKEPSVPVPQMVSVSHPPSGRSPRQRSVAWPLTVIAAVLATGAFLAWDASQKGPVWQLLNRVAGRLESPHPAGRWYEFGYRHGQTHRGVCEALGIPPTAAPADLAYLLKSLGVENPPRDVFELCQRGYEDGVASSPRRYVPDGRGQDGLPESLEGL